MSRVVVQAPGKAVLLGEYAVLEGAPALSMAVDRHARVVIESCAESECCLSAPQLGVDGLKFALDSNNCPEWQIEAPGWAPLERTASLLSYLHGLALQRFEIPQPYRVSIDTEALYVRRNDGSQVKLGLGSSSAVAVALDAGLRCYFGGRNVSGLSLRALKRLLRPYRRSQDGQGSGIDLASSLCGGVIRYRLAEDDVEVSSVILPQNLTLLFVWVGQPASTPRLIQRFRLWRQEQAVRSGQLLEQMNSVCEVAQVAIEQGDAEALVEQFASYGQLMGTIGDQMGVAIMNDVHARVAAEARRLGIAYKPCGAGAGDLGMAAATDPGRLHDLSRWLEDNDLTPVALTIDGQGVTARTETPP